MGKSVQGAQSFSRSIAILREIAEAEPPLSRQELLVQTGLTRPTLHRILLSLQNEGLVEVDSNDRFRPGVDLVVLARRSLARNEILAIALEPLTRLRDQTNETVHLAVPGSDTMVFIHKIESLQTVRMNSTIGTPAAYHSSSVGRAYLSGLPEEEAIRLLDAAKLEQVTEHTITDRLELDAIIVKARQTGFAREDQQNDPGISCFGAPFYDHTNRVVGAVSTSIPQFRLRPDADFYVAPLKAAAAEISHKLGHR